MSAERDAVVEAARELCSWWGCSAKEAAMMMDPPAKLSAAVDALERAERPKWETRPSAGTAVLTRYTVPQDHDWIARHPSDQLVQVRFYGPDAERRAREYAEWQNQKEATP